MRWSIVVVCAVAAALASHACAGRDEPVNLVCENPEPILQADGVTQSGSVRCSDGFRHRAEATTCVVPEPPATCVDDDGAADACTSSAECTDGPLGACLPSPLVFEGCSCVYGCENDADCESDQVCACAGVAGDWPRCVPAGCRTSADCDGLCGFAAMGDACGGVRYELACLDAGSGCRTSCAEEEGCYGNVGTPDCEIVDGAWVCNSASLCEDCG